MRLFMMLVPMMFGCESGGTGGVVGHPDYSCYDMCGGLEDYCSSEFTTDYDACVWACPQWDSHSWVQEYTECLIDTECSLGCQDQYQ